MDPSSCRELRRGSPPRSTSLGPEDKHTPNPAGWIAEHVEGEHRDVGELGEQSQHRVRADDREPTHDRGEEGGGEAAVDEEQENHGDRDRDELGPQLVALGVTGGGTDTPMSMRRGLRGGSGRGVGRGIA